MKNKNEIYNILNSFKTKTDAYHYFNITPNSKGIIELTNLAKSVEFDLNIYKIRRSPKKYCLQCGKELHLKTQKKFCSINCSATYNNTGRLLSDKAKNNIRNGRINYLKKNNFKKVKLCKICGQEKCTNLEVCKHSHKWFDSLSCFGFDCKKIGTIGVYLEYYRIKDLLLKEYFDNEMSPKNISLKYNYNKSFENILHILKTFGVKTRNRSESGINSSFYGNNTQTYPDKSAYFFKYGWHETWDKKLIYYRSSYELEYALELDKNEIFYETEYFRIKYWDTEKQKYRVAIPDFYLKNSNTIVEVKSKVTFNKKNIIDKFNEYIKMGYNVCLLYEKQKYSYNDVSKITEYKYLIENNKK